MEWYWYGGGIADWVFSTATADEVEFLAQLRRGATVNFWRERVEGTQVTELRDAGGVPVTSLRSSDGTDDRAPGQVDQFQSRETQLWASADGGPRVLVTPTDTAARLAAHIADEAAHGGGPDTPAVGGPGVVYVAASGASPTEKARANWVCTGVDDQVQLQAAVDSGVEVLLSRGQFICSAPVIVPAAVTIRGLGRETVIQAAPGLDDYVIRFVTESPDGIIAARISDLTVDGRCDQQTAGGCILAAGAVQCSFERLRLVNPYDWGLVLGNITVNDTYGHHNRVVDCEITQTLQSPGKGGAVLIDGSDENWLSRSSIEYMGGLTPPIGGSDPFAVLILSGLNMISECTFVNAHPLTRTGGHLRIQDCNNVTVQACVFDGSPGHSVFATGSGHSIVGNTVTAVGIDGEVDGGAIGIHLEFGTRENIVANNRVTSSPNADETRALIRLTGDGDAGYNLVLGNSLRVDADLTQAPIEVSGTEQVIEHNVIYPPEA